MSQQAVVDRHMIVPLTDEELKNSRRLALEADLSMKEWLRVSVLEKLSRTNTEPA
ncbi:hypothetical protein LCGC14_0393200 [marine sediment metagenome]|uniref:Uncharacterized protein n=1 Tax=marine sediment metagenome TaxID=412755 RepID=A0A0F9T4X5_9ZZZZ